MQLKREELFPQPNMFDFVASDKQQGSATLRLSEITRKPLQ